MTVRDESGVADVADAYESGRRSALPRWSTDEPGLSQLSGARDVGEPLGGALLEPRVWLQRKVAELQTRAEAAEAALDNLIAGVFTLAAGGRVLHVNRKGEQILAARDGLSLWQDRLRCANPRDTQRLDAAVERAGDAWQGAGVRGSTLAIRRPSRRRPLSGVVAPLRIDADQETLPLVTATHRRGAVLVTVTDPEDVMRPSVENLTSLFDLTPAEARLAAALTGRQTVDEYAAKAGIRPGTARWTLKRVLEKTQCRRQSELVLLLAASVAALLGF